MKKSFVNKVVQQSDSWFFDLGECVKIWIYTPSGNSKTIPSVVLWIHGKGRIIMDGGPIKCDGVFNLEMLTQLGGYAYDFIEYMEKHENSKRLAEASSR